MLKCAICLENQCTAQFHYNSTLNNNKKTSGNELSTNTKNK